MITSSIEPPAIYPLDLITASPFHPNSTAFNSTPPGSFEDYDNDSAGVFTEDYPAVWRTVGPTMLVLGVTGNLLSLLVMRRARMRGTTTSAFLQLLAVYDSLALVSRIGPELFKAYDLFVFSELNRFV